MLLQPNSMRLKEGNCSTNDLSQQKQVEKLFCGTRVSLTGSADAVTVPPHVLTAAALQRILKSGRPSVEPGPVSLQPPPCARQVGGRSWAGRVLGRRAVPPGEKEPDVQGAGYRGLGRGVC